MGNNVEFFINGKFINTAALLVDEIIYNIEFSHIYIGTNYIIIQYIF